MSQALKDEVGNKYGTLIVIFKTRDKNGRTAWYCQCDCGNSKIVRGSDLRTGRITTCGPGCPCKTQRSGVFQNLTGKTFGQLTVVSRATNTIDNKITWHCRCSCGKEKDIRGSDLKTGKIISCGCYKNQLASQRMFKDETGNKYGKLTVLSLYSMKPKVIWRCKCDCGKETLVSGVCLRSGNTKSCGCTLSWKEEEITSLLKKLQIKFIRQYTFPDLLGKEKHPLRFDFAIMKQNILVGLIEYMGRQHYSPIEAWGGEEALRSTQERDKRKSQYAVEHNIPLLVLNKENKNLEEDIKKFVGEIL